MNDPLNMIVHKNIDETKKQREYINDIAVALNLEQPKRMTKVEAAKWIEQHANAFKQQRIDTEFSRVWHQQLIDWHDFI